MVMGMSLLIENWIGRVDQESLNRHEARMWS